MVLTALDSTRYSARPAEILEYEGTYLRPSTGNAGNVDESEVGRGLCTCPVPGDGV
jgi:hypothetical protein